MIKMIKSIAVASFLILAFLQSVSYGQSSWIAPPGEAFHNIPFKNRIIPMGFSRKGVFAYILQENSCREDGQGRKVMWVATNLVNDKTVARHVLGTQPLDVSSRDLLLAYREEIERLNSVHQMARSVSFQLTTDTEIKSKGDALTVKMDLIEEAEGEDAINPGYRKYRISLQSRDKGPKHIAKIKSVYEPLQYWGYYKSPYEERIAVLLLSDFRGCNAYPQMRINVIGAHLNYGF